ncbi:MAG: glycoside hydrolase family 9 protein [Defluviitaleaceae bacterium]|nr:glycoside hydrolase family 9 protein [Defluviitaleaceae bacterium]
MGKSVWVRLNMAGYKPDRAKAAVVLSDADIEGGKWRVKKEGNVVLEGTLAAGKHGDDVHVRQAFYYTVDFSALREAGVYTLELDGAEPRRITVDTDPYAKVAEQAIYHLRTVRSGCPTPHTNAGHPSDAEAVLYVVDGDWTEGKWKEAAPRRTVDMLGGHYDAGDYIKFTLTVASLAWHLLRAYEENPKMFTKAHSTSGLVDLLDEAKHSLDYLAKIFPDENTFIIQVGNGKDHNEGWRLAENDALNGKRPAFCALSRVHMGAAAAALALGAVIFADFDKEAAALYGQKAAAIYARARKDDTRASAFERDATNDFYYDRTDEDNMALAAAELYRLTKDAAYLEHGAAYAPPPTGSVSWSAMNGDANYRLAQHGDASAKERFLKEIADYRWDNVWDLPGGRYTWGSLPVWMGMANNHEIARRLYGGSAESVPFLGVLDYTFGRNNWGIGMVASDEMPDTIKNVYNYVTNVLGKVAVGAMSEGPGRKKTHDSFKHYFSKTEGPDPFEPFNTSAAVFTDDSYDFMIAESTIWGQGNLILMLALA